MTHVKRGVCGVSMTGPEGSSTHRTILRRKLTTLVESSSRKVTCEPYPQCFYPTHTENRHGQPRWGTGSGEETTGGDTLRVWDKWGLRCVCRKFNMRVVFIIKVRADSPQAQCWPRWRIHYHLVSNPMWYIVSPAAAARSTCLYPIYTTITRKLVFIWCKIFW